jgi:hypothetical protein
MTNARKEQAKVLEQMGSITRMRRGHLSEQYNRKKDPDGTERRWGPYYTLQAWVGGKNRSERVPAELAVHVRQDLENYETFSELSERYVELSEGIAKAEDADSKKKPRWFRRPSVGKSHNS